MSHSWSSGSYRPPAVPETTGGCVFAGTAELRLVAAMPAAATTTSVSAVTAAITSRPRSRRAATANPKETVPWFLLIVGSPPCALRHSDSNAFPWIARRIDPIVSCTAPPPTPTVVHASPVPMYLAAPKVGSWLPTLEGVLGGTPLPQAGPAAGSRSLRERLVSLSASSLASCFPRPALLGLLAMPRVWRDPATDTAHEGGTASPGTATNGRPRPKTLFTRGSCATHVPPIVIVRHPGTVHSESSPCRRCGSTNTSSHIPKTSPV